MIVNTCDQIQTDIIDGQKVHDITDSIYVMQYNDNS